MSFQLESKIPVRSLHRALNSRLPDDIRILDLIDAPSGFHAIRDATRKRYRYRIYNSPILDIFRRKYVWQQKMPLDNQAMTQAIEDVRGELDFACFQSTGSPRKTTVRTMTDVRFEAIPVLDGYELIIELEATGFLYNMARNIVGTLVWIGRGKQPADWIPRLIAEGDRRQAGMTAPAHGLTMLKVWYDNVDFEASPILASTEELESAKAAGHRLPADD